MLRAGTSLSANSRKGDGASRGFFLVFAHEAISKAGGHMA